GAGLLFFTALAAFPQTSASGGRGEGWPVWTALFGMGFVSLGLLSVFIKLGRRWRAAFVVRNPFTSWMTREALLAPPTLGLALLAILLNNAILLMAAAVFGLGFLYAQARILQEAQGIPAWREPLTVWLMVTTGLTEGAALWVMMAPLFGGEGIAGTTRSYTALLVGLSAARVGLWAVYRRKLAQPGAAP
ncbi:MAG: phenylacetyl-CoA:acceptor oxidoreductase, partial [Chloroflexota bacterium]